MNAVCFFEDGNETAFIEWHGYFSADGTAERRGGLGNGKTAQTIKNCGEQISSIKHVILTQIRLIQPIIAALCAVPLFENVHFDAMSGNYRVLKTLKTLVSTEKHATLMLQPSLKPCNCFEPSFNLLK